MLVTRTSLFLVPIVCTFALAGLQCSSTSTSGVGDAGGGDSAAADSGGGDSAAADSGTTLNDCSDADLAASDKSDPNAMRTITFPADFTPAQFTPHCMKIKAGQSITWNGDFTSHPLEGLGGDPGNPIMLTMTGMTTSVTFPAAGKFGFDCANHPAIMHGVILVVP